MFGAAAGELAGGAVDAFFNAGLKEVAGRGQNVRNMADKSAPTKKHQQGGWGTLMDLPDNVAQDVLNKSIQGGTKKQKYSYHEGKLYEFQPDAQGGWHGYPIKGTEAPPDVLKKLKENGQVTSAEYKKLVKGKN